MDILIGYRASGIGLVRLALQRANSPFKLVDKASQICEPDGKTIYIIKKPAEFVKKFASRVLVFFRCPASALICCLNNKHNELDRELFDQELEFHTRQFLNDLIFCRSLLDTEANYIKIIKHKSTLDKINRVLDSIGCSEKITNEDISSFFNMYLNGPYYSIDDLPRNARREALKIGTLYDLIQIEPEY